MAQKQNNPYHNKMTSINDARIIIGVSRDFSISELNKKFRILALRLHPDKNGNSPEATTAFQELNAAYRMLLPFAINDRTNKYTDSGMDTCVDTDTSADTDNESYYNIFMNFMKSLLRPERKSQRDDVEGINPFLLDLLHRIVHDYASVSVNAALDSLDPSVLFQLYDMLEQYNATVSMDSHIFEEITQTIREKMQKNNIVILRPSLKDVLQNNISVLQFEGQTFYVPLWHSELHYRINDTDKQLIVKCVPELPGHMSIDSNNELHIDVRADIKELLMRSSGTLRVPLYDDVCVELKVSDLRIVSRQIVVLRDTTVRGISLICANDIYDVKKQAPICVHVQLV